MTRALNSVAAALALILAAGCGVDDGASTTSLAEDAPSSSTTTASTTTMAATTESGPMPPSILGLSSGRGDDGSLEVVVSLASDPFSGDDHRVVIGTDADDSYPGTGDPFPHLDGWLAITPDEAALFDGPTEVASGDALRELASWGLVDGTLRVFFIGNVPVRGGTTWVIVEADGAPVQAGVAGAPFGVACSHHGSGITVPPGADISDAGTPCRYG